MFFTYSGIEKIEKVIEYIEEHITEEIDCEALASQMALSVYEFRRIFSFIIGCPLSEYVRKRRLSLAACELARNKSESIQKISEKYGYSTLSAFSKAFSEQHGSSPLKCRSGKCNITLFSKPQIDFSIRHTEGYSFSIVSDKEFYISGYRAISDHSDSECCEGVWSEFYKLGYDGKISSDKIYASYSDISGNVCCNIGERVDKSDNSELIPACKWLTVKMNSTDDILVNKKYSEILYEVLPSAQIEKRTDLPTVEVFPLDMSEDAFTWEIRIPIKEE